jgi:hypothetical protein
MLLLDHFLGPNNVGNMSSSEDTKLTGTLYNGEKMCFTWETFVRIHTEQHMEIKITELDVCKTQVMASPSLRDDFSATVEIYSTFIKQMKAEKPSIECL